MERLNRDQRKKLQKEYSKFWKKVKRKKLDFPKAHIVQERFFRVKQKSKFAEARRLQEEETSRVKRLREIKGRRAV